MNNHHGFTLIEIIITFVVISILSAMFIPYYLSGVTTQTIPINRLSESIHLSNAMEAIVSDYYTNVTFAAQNSQALEGLINKVNSFTENYPDICSSCSAVGEVVEAGELTTSVLVTVTSSNNEKVYRLFTVQGN